MPSGRPGPSRRRRRCLRPPRRARPAAGPSLAQPRSAPPRGCPVALRPPDREGQSRMQHQARIGALDDRLALRWPAPSAPASAAPPSTSSTSSSARRRLANCRQPPGRPSPLGYPTPPRPGACPSASSELRDRSATARARRSRWPDRSAPVRAVQHIGPPTHHPELVGRVGPLQLGRASASAASTVPWARSRVCARKRAAGSAR